MGMGLVCGFDRSGVLGTLNSGWESLAGRAGIGVIFLLICPPRW